MALLLTFPHHLFQLAIFLLDIFGVSRATGDASSVVHFSKESTH